MSILENIRSALGAISSNKLRSALTMLGIIIGVTSVVLLIAIGKAAQKSVTARIESLGTNLLTVTPGSPNQTNVRFGGGGGGGASTALKQTDVAAIQEHVGHIKALSPESQSRLQAINGSLNASVTVLGATQDYPGVRNVKVAYGDFFTAQNLEQTDKVAVLGPQVVASLFPDDPSPLGKDVRLQGGIYTVIGILESKGQQGGSNQDNIIVIPLTTMQRRITGSQTVGSVAVSVDDAENMALAQQQITAVLLSEHGITDVQKQDFTVLNQADAVQTLNDVTGTFTLLLGGIAAISLLVGGIGVMNIMLVSVTERTREIGIRKAIGAKKRDILFQFLIESTVLSVMGGGIGILLSWIGAFLVKSQFGLDASIDASSVLLAFAFSVGVGIFFGMLPAYTAAKLRPIQALRYE
jgi:putative ABC transport system permease protein